MSALFLVWALAGCSEASKTTASGPPCPTALPRAGASCIPHVDGGITPICEYGGTEHGQCKTQAWCDRDTSGAFHWSVSAPDATCGKNANECPSAFGTGENGACPAESDCSYPEGVCSCVPCTTDAGPQRSTWQCQKWSDFDQACLHATLGKSCSGENGKLCVGCPACSGFPSVTNGAICQDGYWQQFISTACDCAPGACR